MKRFIPVLSTRAWVMAALFLLLAIVQLWVPLNMVSQYETVLRQGEIYRFRVGPVDPYDPFRGRYLALDIYAAQVPQPAGKALRPGHEVYALLRRNDAGFAEIVALRDSPPPQSDYIRTTVKRREAQAVVLNLPFDRYYITEPLAFDAEQAFREQQAREDPVPYVRVRVKDGAAALEDLYVWDTPIMRYLERMTRRQ